MTPTCLRSDNGLEFFNKNCQKLGIHHQSSCAYTPQQNGVMERKHRHIVENGLTLLAQASLPLKYWDEAYRTSVYIHNRAVI